MIITYLLERPNSILCASNFAFFLVMFRYQHGFKRVYDIQDPCYDSCNTLGGLELAPAARWSRGVAEFSAMVRNQPMNLTGRECFRIRMNYIGWDMCFFLQLFFESREAETGDFRGLETKVMKLKLVFPITLGGLSFPAFEMKGVDQVGPDSPWWVRLIVKMLCLTSSWSFL